MIIRTTSKGGEGKRGVRHVFIKAADIRDGISYYQGRISLHGGPGLVYISGAPSINDK